MNHAISRASISPNASWLMTLTFVILSFAIPHSAQSAVIYSGVQNIAIPTTFDGVYLDIDTATTSTSVITGWDVNPFFGGYAIGNSAAFQPVRSGTGNSDSILNLAYGTLVDSLLNYATGEAGSSDHIGGGAYQFTEGAQGYLGFKFTTNSSAGPFYGWMRVTLTANTSGALIHDWAYDNTGSGLLVGSLTSVPEPGRALLVMVGLASTLLRRHRQMIAK